MPPVPGAVKTGGGGRKTLASWPSRSCRAQPSTVAAAPVGRSRQATKGGAMPRHQPARDEGDDRFHAEPRYERLLPRTDVELAWIYERHPDLEGKIGAY